MLARQLHLNRLLPADFWSARLPDEIYEAVAEGLVDELMRRHKVRRRLIGRGLNFADMERVNQVEKAAAELELRKHDKSRCRLRQELGHFMIELAGQAENLHLHTHDRVLLESPSRGRALLVQIERFLGDWILLRIGDNVRRDFMENFATSKLNIYFVASGLPYTLYEEAISWFKEGLDTKRAPIAYDRCKRWRPACAPTRSLWPGRDRGAREARLNSLQRRAVSAILASPRLYVLFGPPGTGKTHTLVEAVVQIFLRSSERRLLFCASSNNCADEIHRKLLETRVFSEADLVRLRSGEYIDQKRRPRVVVTTNSKSCSLRNWSKFDYLIVDEAGHANESECLVPMCSLRAGGCLVLAGDPHQLGPFIRCKQTAPYWPCRSVLERVMNFDQFKPRADTNDYDAKFITMLRQCYRCDPRILELPNGLFYEGKLEGCNGTPGEMLRDLNLSHPLQLIYCEDREEARRGNSTSLMNRTEIAKAIDLVIRLYLLGVVLPHEIAIMSPYKLQTHEMQKALRRRLNEPPVAKLLCELAGRRKLPPGPDGSFDWNCKVDTVDSFQGDEREVIVFSHVRPRWHGDDHSDFLNDPKRFNVAMTRAKWLMFVIGDEQVINSSKYWKQVPEVAGQDVEKASWMRAKLSKLRMCPSLGGRSVGQAVSH